MMFMNEHEIEETRSRFDSDETPNLGRAAAALHNLMEWTNQNSDGWPYWRKPAQSAQRLMDMLNEATNAYWTKYEKWDVREADVTKALQPVKAFLTRQGAKWEEIL